MRSGVDLRAVARYQRRLFCYAIPAVAIIFVPPALAQVRPGLGVVAGCFLFALMILVSAGVARLLGALRAPVAARIACIALLLAPGVSVLMLVVLRFATTKILGSAGLRVGLTGVCDRDVLRVMDPCRCRHCGYSLVGNSSGRCPECGAPVEIYSVDHPKST